MIYISTSDFYIFNELNYLDNFYEIDSMNFSDSFGANGGRGSNINNSGPLNDSSNYNLNHNQNPKPNNNNNYLSKKIKKILKEKEYYDDDPDCEVFFKKKGDKIYEFLFMNDAESFDYDPERDGTLDKVRVKTDKIISDFKKSEKNSGYEGDLEDN